MVNLAALQAMRNIATGRRIDRWEPQRAAEPTGTAAAPLGAEPTTAAAAVEPARFAAASATNVDDTLSELVG